MSQLITVDHATLEQLVMALNNAEDALNNSQALIAGRERLGFAKTAYAANENALGFISLAITAGRAALSNAEPKQPKTKSCATCKHSDSDGFPACLAQGATCYPQASGFGTNWEALNK